MNLKVLILDDRRAEKFDERFSTLEKSNITHVTNAKDCIEKLSTQQYDIIFLDYDLTYMEMSKPSKENTGADVARWLKKHQMNSNHKAHIIIHSPDPHGSAFMKELLPKAIVLPGAWMRDQFNDLLKKLNLK